MPFSTFNMLTHRHFTVIDSTNTALIQAIQTATHRHDLPVLYTADSQTQGRGQHGRTWQNSAGNVFLSLYVPIGGDRTYSLAQLSGLLSLAVGLSLLKLPLIQAINQQRQKDALAPISLKWANDLGVYDALSGKFGKLGGILIEPVFMQSPTPVGAVIGVGLNVASTPMIDDEFYAAVCLADLTDEPLLNTDALYQPICQSLGQAIALTNRLNDPATCQAFIAEYNHHHGLQGKNLAVFVQNDLHSPTHLGKCVGIDTQGGLLLQNKDTISTIYAGTVKLRKDT